MLNSWFVAKYISLFDKALTDIDVLTFCWYCIIHNWQNSALSAMYIIILDMREQYLYGVSYSSLKVLQLTQTNVLLNINVIILIWNDFIQIFKYVLWKKCIFIAYKNIL